METEKIRNLSDGELVEQERQAAEQLFRLRFQMKLGQNEGVKKVRELRKDVARIKRSRANGCWVCMAMLRRANLRRRQRARNPRRRLAKSWQKQQQAKPQRQFPQPQ